MQKQLFTYIFWIFLSLISISSFAGGVIPMMFIPPQDTASLPPPAPTIVTLFDTSSLSNLCDGGIFFSSCVSSLNSQTLNMSNTNVTFQCIGLGGTEVIGTRLCFSLGCSPPSSFGQPLVNVFCQARCQMNCQLP